MLQGLKQRGRVFLRSYPRLWRHLSSIRVALRPQSLSGRLALANALRQEGNSSAAAEILHATLKLHPNCPPGAHVELLLGFSGALCEAGDYEQALAHVQKAVSLQPESRAARDMLGELLFLCGRGQDAIAYRIGNNRGKIAQNPNDRDALLGLAHDLFLTGALQEAREACDRALAIEAPDLKTYQRIWQAQIRAGCSEAAQHYFRVYRAAQRQEAQCAGFADDGTRYLGPNWTAHVGHISHLDLYLKTKALGLSSVKRVMVLAGRKVANLSYLECWKPHVEIVSDPVAIQGLSRRAACFEDHVLMLSFDKRNEHAWNSVAGAKVQQRWQAEGRKPLLTLSEDHIRRGRAWLQSLGVPADAWFVTVHVREPGFHEVPYHSHRDALPQRYLKAFRHITARGGWVIRMGNPAMTVLAPLERVIDYAHFADRRDWIDVFLASQCRFHIGTQAGISYVPPTFGVPTVWTNFVSWGVPGYLQEDLFIPKQFWSETEGRPLTLHEILGTDLAVNQFDFLLTRGGSIRLIENTEDEILAAVCEMLDRLDGKLSYQSADEEGQAIIRRIGARYGYVINPRLGQAYLRDNRYLLKEEV